MGSAPNDLVVLCYHGVSDDWPSEYAVTPAALRAQVGALVRRGYRPATFTDAVTAPRSGPTLAVTFDDAYRSVLERGRPVLDELGVPATVFACTAFVGDPEPMRVDLDEWLAGPHAQELVSLSWEQLGELARGGWEVGSHTRTHARLTDADDAALADELRGSRADCESALDVPCRAVAYPKGALDARVAEAARAAGYEAGGALLGTFDAPEPLRWPRVVVFRSDGPRAFRLKTHPLARRVRGSRGWRALRPAYHRLRGGAPYAREG